MLVMSEQIKQLQSELIKKDTKTPKIIKSLIIEKTYEL